MNVLVVAATATEVAPLVARLQPRGDRNVAPTRYAHAGHEIDVLVTGVGMVATAVWCTRALSQARYDVALNLGVCGSFDRSLLPGTAVHVVTDRITDLGAQDGGGFLTIQELGLLDENEFPFSGGRLVNRAVPSSAELSRLRPVDGITVNTVHGDEPSIAAVVDRFAPHVESMEGAAFMYACLVHQLEFAQVRAVSNVVERRNRATWKLPEAVSALANAGLAVLETL
jgi:futalosine hydrolase